MELPRRIILTEEELSNLLQDISNDTGLLAGESSEVALKNYLALTHFPSAALGAARIGEVELFYNRYYWFLKAVRSWQRDHGADAGMEQQAFRLLEHAGIEFDWGVVEKIEQRIANEIDAEAG